MYLNLRPARCSLNLIKSLKYKIRNMYLLCVWRALSYPTLIQIPWPRSFMIKVSLVSATVVSLHYAVCEATLFLLKRETNRDAVFESPPPTLLKNFKWQQPFLSLLNAFRGKQPEILHGFKVANTPSHSRHNRCLAALMLHFKSSSDFFLLA